MSVLPTLTLKPSQRIRRGVEQGRAEEVYCKSMACLRADSVKQMITRCCRRSSSAMSAMLRSSSGSICSVNSHTGRQLWH